MKKTIEFLIIVLISVLTVTSPFFLQLFNGWGMLIALYAAWSFWVALLDTTDPLDFISITDNV